MPDEAREGIGSSGEDQIAFYLHVDLGSKLLSKPELRKDADGLDIRTVGRKDPRSGASPALPADMVEVLKSAGSAAAIVSFFNFLSKLVSEIYRER